MRATRTSRFEVFSGADYFHEYPDGDRVYYAGVAYTTTEVMGEPLLDRSEVQEIRHFDLGALPAPLLTIARGQLERLRASRIGQGLAANRTRS